MAEALLDVLLQGHLDLHDPEEGAGHPVLAQDLEEGRRHEVAGERVLAGRHERRELVEALEEDARSRRGRGARSRSRAGWSRGGAGPPRRLRAPRRPTSSHAIWTRVGTRRKNVAFTSRAASAARVGTRAWKKTTKLSTAWAASRRGLRRPLSMRLLQRSPRAAGDRARKASSPIGGPPGTRGARNAASASREPRAPAAPGAALETATPDSATSPSSSERKAGSKVSSGGGSGIASLLP